MSGAPGAEGFAGWLHRITPYIREHRGRIFVLHAGGELLYGKRLEALARDIIAPMVEVLGSLITHFCAREQLA